MLRLGEMQTLEIVKKVDFGVYLAEGGEPQERVLLPAKQVPEGARPGDKLEVFLYRDSSDRPIATTRRPKLTLGETAVLEVVEVSRIGAFLDWGWRKICSSPSGSRHGGCARGSTAWQPSIWTRAAGCVRR